MAVDHDKQGSPSLMTSFPKGATAIAEAVRLSGPFLLADKMSIELDQQTLKDMLTYDPGTGVFTWNIKAGNRSKGSFAGTKMSEGYLCVGVRKTRYYLHRLAWLYVYGTMPDGLIDHINGIRTDNRIENLRDVSVTDNVQNIRVAKKDSKSGVLGVSWAKKSKKWRASIRINGVCKSLGHFDDIEDAKNAYVDAKRLHHRTCTI